MIKQIKHFLSIVAILLNLSVFSQEGTPLISNFTFGETSIDNESWAMTQGPEGHMMFATRRGIVSFDGMRWNTILTPSVPLSLFYENETKEIFVGCKNNIGKLTMELDGMYKYTPLVREKKEFGDIEQITSLNGLVYFYSSEFVTSYSVATGEIFQWKADPGEPFTGFFTNKSNVYINIDKLGVHILKESLKVPLRGGEKLFDQKVVFFIKYGKSQTLIGTDMDSLYLFSGSKLHPFQIESEDYIRESILAGGLNLDKDNFVLSTITGGCLIIDKETKQTKYTLNYQTGLPDDEIYAMGVDRNNGLWLLHEYGMSRVDLKLPIRNVNHYPGLEGNITSVIDYDSSLFVSTSEGVYHLSEVKNYEEIDVLVNNIEIKKEVESPKEKKKERVPLTKENTQIIKEKEAKKGRFWNRLFKKRKKKRKRNENLKIKNDVGHEELESETAPEENEPLEETGEKEVVRRPIVAADNSEFESKKIYALQSISHTFSKVSGIVGKVKQMLQHNDMLLAAGNTGLYQISNFKATIIIPDKYINFVFQSGSDVNKFYVGTTEGLLILKWINNTWVVEDELKDFKENVYSVLEMDKNNLWVGSENIAYNILIDNAGFPVSIKPYPFKTDFTERILVRSVMNIPYFFLSTGLYSYNAKIDSIVFNQKNNKGFTGQSKYIFSQKNITWVFNEHKWIGIHDRSRYTRLPEEFLELFDDVSNIYVDFKNNMWVIDNNNSIYKILNVKVDYEDIFNVYLNFIVGKDGELLSKDNLELSYDENSLRFNISAPYFVRSNAINFQYYIEGLNNSWSDWSENHSIDLPFIPNGDFVLHVKARNILGKVTKTKTYRFSISAPFYKKWWFFLLCVVAFLLLGWIILRLRERQLNNQKRVLEERIKIRTIQLEKEKEKAEKLLLNILPKKTAQELQKYGKAKARSHDHTSVMFTDFKGFTLVAEKLSSTELVMEIDHCFSKFDDIIERYDVEKIKTIGDAYMCASGIPIKNINNPVLITLAGLEIAHYMEIHIENRKREKLPFFELRIGIHTGPLIAGVVGKKKFAYDIWGDTVNTAARMESSGEVGMVNISEVTYKEINEYFEFEARGKIEAKNKGKIEMYFVKRIKAKYAQDANGRIPNEKFKKRIDLKW